MARRSPPRRTSSHKTVNAAVSKISEEQVSRAKDFFRQFEVSLKSAALYSHKKDQFDSYLKNPHEALKSYIAEYGPLKLTVKPLDFFLGDTSIYHDEGGDNNLCYKFYREGFRTLTFNEGIALRELVSLMEVLILSTRELSQEDLTTRLWKLNLEKFEYLILEGLDGDEAAKGEVDKAVAFIHQLIHTEDGAAVNFRGIADEDFMLEKSLKGAQSKRGLKKKVNRIEEKEQQAIQKVLESEKDKLPDQIVELTLFMVTNATNMPDLNVFFSHMPQLCEYLLLSRHLEALAFLVKDSFEIGEEIKPQLHSALHHFRDDLHRYLGSNELLIPVVQMLGEWKLLTEKQQHALMKYLTVLRPYCGDALIQQVGGANSLTRRALLNILLEDEMQRAHTLQHLLADYGEDANFMLDLLAISREIADLFDLESLQSYINSPHPQVRMEGLLTLGTLFPEAAQETAQLFLHDAEAANRRVAVEVLSKIRPAGVAILRAFIESPNFPKLAFEEQTSFFRFLGQNADKELLFWFGELLEQKSGFFTRRVNQMKELAVQGLQSSSESLAGRLLKKSLEEGKHSKELKKLLEKAIQNQNWS